MPLTSTLSIFDRRPNPPTPPIDRSEDQAISEALDFLSVDFSLSKPVLASEKVASGLGTPPKSSPLAQNDPPSSREKKVGFRSWTVQHNGPSPKKTTTELRPLPQTRRAKPLKSILKANVCYTPTPDDERLPSTGYFSPERPLSVPKMLDSVVQALTSSDSLMRLDGYQTLNGALKAYTNFPNEDALRERLPQLQSFVLRDVKSSSHDTRNTNLTTQALKLSVSLLQLTALSSSITNDFRATLLDTALNVLGSKTPNKAIANHFLYLLASPDFRPRSLTPAKADLLLAHLDGISNRISGNSVVAGRLTIYLRLIEQVPTVMLTKFRSWIEHIFHGCLSNNEDICRRAIDCGLRAGLEFGNHYNAQKAIVEIFATETAESGTYGDYFVSRLSDMTSDASRSSLVPRMWSSVILFFRNQKRPITSWQMLRPLLIVIQQCLNSSDIQTKYQATIAWNRLVYVVNLDTVRLDPMEKLVAMLKVPFSTAFRLQISSARGAMEARKTAHFGYTNLLYYALQPSQSFERLDILWNTYANDLLPKMLRTGDMDGKFANRALKALFFDGAQTWNPEKANTSQEIKVEELPRLDSSWLRSRLPKLLASFEGYFGASLCVSSAGSDVYETPWRQLVFAVAEAGSQEVRTSTETREALAHLMNFLRKTWTHAARWVKDLPPKTFIWHFGKMLNVCVQAFGTMVFLEQNIAVDKAELVQPAPTPSNRSSKHHVLLESPFHFLVKMLCTPHAVLNHQEAIVGVVESFLELVLQSQSSIVSRLSLLRQCLSNVKAEAKKAETSLIVSNLSDVILAAAASSLRSDQEPENRKPQYGVITKHMNAMLVEYLSVQDESELPATWTDAFNALADQLLSCGGEFLVHLGLVDPLVQTIECTQVELLVQITTALVPRAAWLTSREQVDKTMKILGANHLDSTKRSTSFLQNGRMSRFINQTLQQLYSNLETCGSHAVNLLRMVNLYLQRFPSVLGLAPFCEVSSGLTTIIEDKEGKLVQDTLSSSALREQVFMSWKTISSNIQTLQFAPQALEMLSPILISGFRSRHTSVVNDAINTWNTTFGQRTDLEYPDALLVVLGELSNHVQIEVPSVSVEAMSKVPAVTLPAFSDGAYPIDANDEAESANPAFTSRIQRQKIASFPRGKATPIKDRAVMDALSSKSKTTTPKSKAFPLPTLRHDDSQIEFVAVENLPTELMNDGTQGLTGHQMEVRDRQQQEAAGFLGQFTSSPTPASTTKNLIVDRVLESMHNDSVGGRLSTPEIADDIGLVDETLGSSPSAQSAQRAQSRSSRQGSSPPIRIRQPLFLDPGFDSDGNDIPSSPPEQPDDYVFDPESVFSTTAEPSPVRILLKDVELNDDDREATDGEDLEADISDDLGRPTAYVLVSPLQTQRNLDARSTAMENKTLNRKKSTKTLHQPDMDISRVEDSFLGQSSNSTALVDKDDGLDEVISEAATPATPRSMRKRRRSDAAVPSSVSASKRRKRPSPLKRILSLFGGSKAGDEEQEEELEDCIVVATQPEDESTNPEETEVLQTAPQPEVTDVPAVRTRGRPKKATILTNALPKAETQVAEEPEVLQTTSLPESTDVPAVRTRGRAKKATSLTNAVADESKPLDTLKRKRMENELDSGHDTNRQTALTEPTSSDTTQRRSSRLSGGVEGDQGLLSGLPKRKTRRRTKGQDAKAAAAMDISQSLDNEEDSGRQVEREEMELSPESQLRREAAAAENAVERPFASPRSILGRLKNILVDVKDMGMKFVLGQQEQMEISGLLFELGHEVHAAGQRGAS